MEKDFDNSEIRALVSLLDEPDEKMYHPIQEKIVSYGIDVVSMLEDVWEGTLNGVVQMRIENVIEQIQFRDTYSELKEWSSIGQDDLLKGIYIISKYAYPGLDFDNFISKIDRIQKDIWLEFNDELTGLEKIRVINHIFFEIHKYKGEAISELSPQSILISDVVDSKKGTSVSIGVLYLIIAQSMKLPIYGVQIPNHFILAYMEYSNNLIKESENSVLFYINPFRQGAAFSKNEIESYLEQIKQKPEKKYFYPCGNKVVLNRMIQDLIQAYEKEGSVGRVADLRELQSLV